MSSPNYSSVGQWVLYLWALIFWQLLWCFTHTPVFTVGLKVDWIYQSQFQSGENQI